MKKILIAFIIASLFLACNNGSGKQEITKTDTTITQKEIVQEPMGAPAKLVGSFAGLLPCKDCQVLERLVVLTENTYVVTERYVGTKIKTAPFSTYNGTCKQENGFITLFDNDNKSLQTYKIIAKDSIEYIVIKRKEPKLDKRYFLVRKDGKKLVD